MKNKSKTAAAFAILAAALYAVNIPFSKLLLGSVGSTMLAALLYLGAGLGLGAVSLAERLGGRKRPEKPLTKKELPYTIGMILLDTAAPILLLLGLGSSSAESVSLLGNFEIVATSIIAMAVFGEVVSKRLWAAIALITISSLVLSFDGAESLCFFLPGKRCFPDAKKVNFKIWKKCISSARIAEMKWMSRFGARKAR